MLAWAGLPFLGLRFVFILAVATVAAFAYGIKRLFRRRRDNAQ